MTMSYSPMPVHTYDVLQFLLLNKSAALISIIVIVLKIDSEVSDTGELLFLPGH